MQVIDRKFRFTAVNPCNGKIYDETNAFIICAKDAAALDALAGYITGCEKVGAKPEHIQSIEMLLDRVKKFQIIYGARIPDTVGQCELDRCIGGIGLDK